MAYLSKKNKTNADSSQNNVSLQNDSQLMGPIQNNNFTKNQAAKISNRPQPQQPTSNESVQRKNGFNNNLWKR